MAATMTLDEITGGVVDAAYRLHKGLGPGLLESVYETVLARDLQRRGFQVERQKPIAFDYDGMHFDDGLRVDLLVERCVVIEIKSVERLLPVHPQAGSNLSASIEAARGTVDQFRSADAEAGSATHRQRARSVRVSASPREPNRPRSLATPT